MKYFLALALACTALGAAAKGLELTVSYGFCTNTRPKLDGTILLQDGDKTQLHGLGALQLAYKINTRLSAGLRAAVMPWISTHTITYTDLNGNSLPPEPVTVSYGAPAITIAPVVRWKLADKPATFFVDALAGLALTKRKNDGPRMLYVESARGLTAGAGIGYQCPFFGSDVVNASIRVGIEFAAMTYNEASVGYGTGYRIVVFPVMFGLEI